MAIADTLAPALLPNYYIEVETRTYTEQGDEEDDLLIGIPDAAVLSATSTASVQRNQLSEGELTLAQRPQSIALPMPTTVKERYLEVREIGSEAVITVIEVLSPKNKRKGQGRTAYERQRSRILGSLSHLIEVDLLRAHPPMTMLGHVQPTHYRIVVSRSEHRPQADLYGFNLPEPIPSFPLPLKPEEREPTVDLQAIVEGVCERAGYNQRLDYRQPISPPISVTDRQWVERLLAEVRKSQGRHS